MKVDLTEGSVTKKMMLFSLPLMAGNLLQQCYNIADTLIGLGSYAVMFKDFSQPQIEPLI